MANLIVLLDQDLQEHEIGLSNNAYCELGFSEKGGKIKVAFAAQPPSFGYLREKIYGKALGDKGILSIIKDVSKGKYSDTELAALMISCTRLTRRETVSLTRSMVEVGNQFSWSKHPIVDKHCIGGVPGNRTTMIFVPILVAHGLTVPKLSSRAITSPAGTADTMEVIAPVNLSYEQMRNVVEKEGGCMAWGGGQMRVSPVDSEGSYVERSLDINLYHWFVPAILSTKIAVGSTHVLIDIPVGPTAKVESIKAFETLSEFFEQVGSSFGLNLLILKSDGSQPIGRGIGPVLEARDVLSVLRCEERAPQDLRDKSLKLAGLALEAWGGVETGQGYAAAESLLATGKALQKFEAICKAQGGMRDPVLAKHKYTVLATCSGIVTAIDNYLMSRVARLAGAPVTPAAGIDLYISLKTQVEKGEPLFSLYAETREELDYALEYVDEWLETMIQIRET